MEPSIEKPRSRREIKRTDTLSRIRNEAMRLFLEQSYDATTLDAIAAAAGISRRTFFYYFKSKEEILVASQGISVRQNFESAMLAESMDQEPYEALRSCLLGLVSRLENKESMAVDRLVLSTETLRTRKLSFWTDMEAMAVDTMAGMWPERPAREFEVVAMLAFGALRLAMECWRADSASHPVAYHLRQVLEAMDGQYRGEALRPPVHASTRAG